MPFTTFSFSLRTLILFKVPETRKVLDIFSPKIYRFISGLPARSDPASLLSGPGQGDLRRRSRQLQRESQSGKDRL